MKKFSVAVLTTFRFEFEITWNRSTSNEWIPCESFWASTYGLMIVNIASGLWWTNSDTRINATFINASQIARTFRICNAFRSTIWSSADIIWQARTNRSITNFTTLWIWSAWRWHTTNRLNWNNRMTHFFLDASNEWIASVTNFTATNWIVINHLASGVLTAYGFTWIFAFLIDAWLVESTFRTNQTFWATIWRRSNHFR